MRVPNNIISEWQQFVAECCLGVAPAQTPSEINRAFTTLCRIWPERVAALEASGQAGLLFIAPAVALGLTLADCEGLSGFAPVFARLTAGETSAGAELTVAAGLVRGGFVPELEPPLGASVLDSVVTVSGLRVYIEVISPETSAEMRDAMQDISRLAAAIADSTTNSHTEILLAVEPETRHETIVATIREVPADEVIRELDGIGKVRRTIFPPDVVPNVGSTIENRDPRPVLAVAQGRFDQGARTSATVRLPMTDDRAHRLLSAELHHFSKDEANILVVHVTRVPGGLGWWLPLVERWFQPGRNTRVGAVALYEEGLVGMPLASHPRWRVVVNPFARIRVPDRVVEAIRSLDESDAWGGGGAA